MYSYKQLFDKFIRDNSLKTGSKVKVDFGKYLNPHYRFADELYLEWGYAITNDMYRNDGQILSIDYIGIRSIILVNNFSSYNYPFFVLKPAKTIKKII